MTRTGMIRFFSSAPLEDIEAKNNKVTAILSQDGRIAIQLPMQSFDFAKRAMQNHFNKDYLHTDKFPFATFEGKITEPQTVDYTKDGVYVVSVEGDLAIHGEKRAVKEKGTVTVKNGNVQLLSIFSIILGDYGVKVPSNFIMRISDSVEITVDCILSPTENK